MTLMLASFLPFGPTTRWNPATRLDSINLGSSWLFIVRIPPGQFWMGTNLVLTAEENWTNDVERPVHQVTMSNDFWLGEFAVTQRQFQEVMGNNPSYFRDAGPDAPVEQVDWNQVQAFLAEVNAAQSQWTVRMPTEAEWEYAARAGTTDERYGPIDQIAWTARTARAPLIRWG